MATLAAGSKLRVRTTSEISTKTMKTGERFVATLEEAWTEGDWVVARKGATVQGRIVESDPGGRVKGKASIVVSLVSLETTDGETVELNTSQHAREAQSSAKKDALKVGIASGVGAAIGAIAGGGKGAAIGAGAGAGAGTGVVMATRGDPAVIPSETVLTFELQAPVTVTKR